VDTIGIIALGMGAAWASGINLYATVLALGLLNLTGHVALPPQLQILSDPLVLAAAALMYAVEFFADKVPGVDTGWDAIHTFVRIPAGALLAAGAVAEVGPAAELAAVLVGGGVAAAAHVTKAGGRVLINTSPEPVTNWAASVAEDVLAVAGVWTALNHPWLFLALLGLFLALLVWLLPRLWGAVRRLGRALAGLARRGGRPAPGDGGGPRGA